jgi:2-phospho-L-lactate guanylyltransferase (CobY/MobA/RfbA family)
MKIEFADLGDWGQETELVSEYDPDGPVIRINSRIADKLSPEERADFVKRAIAHELYHHMEHCGDIPVIADRAAREAAAALRQTQDDMA